MNPAVEEAYRAWLAANPTLCNTDLMSFSQGWREGLGYCGDDHREVEAQKVDELSEELTAILSGHSGYEEHAEIMRDHPLYGLDDATLARVGAWLDEEAERLRAIRLDAQP